MHRLELKPRQGCHSPSESVQTCPRQSCTPGSCRLPVSWRCTRKACIHGIRDDFGPSWPCLHRDYGILVEPRVRLLRLPSPTRTTAAELSSCEESRARNCGYSESISCCSPPSAVFRFSSVDFTRKGTNLGFCFATHPGESRVRGCRRGSAPRAPLRETGSRRHSFPQSLPWRHRPCNGRGNSTRLHKQQVDCLTAVSFSVATMVLSVFR